MCFCKGLIGDFPNKLVIFPDLVITIYLLKKNYLVPLITTSKKTNFIQRLKKKVINLKNILPVELVSL